MRGAERPSKVKWNRPFLAPLEPLPPSASRQTFLDIAEEPAIDEESDFAELLRLTENLPLAVNLMANIASVEGYSNAFARWKLESVALLSDGFDKRTNLEKSIMVSLSSPRMVAAPHARSLLGILSLLPDGLSNDELLGIELDIPCILECRSSLLRMTLAYIHHSGRLRALNPIREYMLINYPPSTPHVQSVRIYWQKLLKVWDSHQQVSSRDLVPRLTSNLGNIRSVILHALTQEGPVRPDVGDGILLLDRFSGIMLQGGSDLMQYIPRIIQSTGDEALKWEYIQRCLLYQPPRIPTIEADTLITQGIQHFEKINDQGGQGTT
jgi:hypothetical protein